MSRMPWRTRLFTTILDRMPGMGITRLDEEGIVRARAARTPQRWPYSAITGPVARGVSIQDGSFAARDGGAIPIRVYRPRGLVTPPVLVYLHGGGWVLGSTHRYDPLCSRLAAEARCLVISVDYRMAPQHRAPQAVHDCIDAVAWVASEGAGTYAADASRLAVAGDSAGGNLAALVCQAALDAGGPAIAHQSLIYPAVDLTKSFPSIREHAKAPILTERDMDAYLAHYFGPQPAVAPDDPLVSPYWRSDLTGLPPALVQTADLDPLRDEGLAYARRLKEAGVQVRVTNYLGAVHGFLSFPGATVIGRQALHEVVTEVREHLH